MKTDALDILGMVVKQMDESLPERRGDGERVPQTAGTGEFMALERFREYALSECDVKIIAILWKDYTEQGGSGLKWSLLCSRAGMDIHSTGNCLKYLVGLMNRKIIRLNQCGKSDFEHSLNALLTGRYYLTKSLLLRIFGKNMAEVIKQKLTEEWLSDNDLCRDLHICLETFFQAYGEYDRRETLNAESIDTDLFIECLYPLKERIKSAANDTFIITTIRETGLNDAEIYVLMLVLFYQISQRVNISDKELLTILSRNKEEYRQHRELLSPQSKLFTANILEYLTHDFMGLNRQLNITEDFQLMRHNADTSGKTAEGRKELSYYLKQEKSLQVVKTAQRLNDLIIPAAEKRLLEAMILRYVEPESFNLDSWGFGSTAYEHSERHKGLVALFYGLPGTGKTFAAGAVANELNKGLVAIECSELRNMWYGETDKAVKKVFATIKTMARELENPPVFLLNEADKLIHKRTEEPTSCGRVENSIQNIVLEELEDFPAILILTTNIEEMIDEAYFRRFNIKLQFQLPDYDCRCKLWRLHLHKGIPGAEEIDVEMLAGRYEFSGGEIALVVRNGCSEAITRKEEQRRLTLPDIIRYADMERPWQRCGLSRDVGF